MATRGTADTLLFTCKTRFASHTNCINWYIDLIVTHDYISQGGDESLITFQSILISDQYCSPYSHRAGLRFLKFLILTSKQSQLLL